MSTALWWDTWLDHEGRDSEEEAAFQGYLYQQGIPASASPDVLQAAYETFLVFMAESEARESADPGPDAADLAAEDARVRVLQRTVPKSRVAAPGVDKPFTAATRPKATRAPLADAPPGPHGEAQVAPPSGEGAASASSESSPTSDTRYGRRRSESSEGA